MKFSGFRHSRTGFTLIELLVGMTIFSLGITSIFLLLQSTLKSVTLSRNEVVVANLLREQLELVRNIRDTNILQASVWDNAKIDGSSHTNLVAGDYIIENNFQNDKAEFQGGKMIKSPVSLKKITLPSDKKDIFNDTQLCFDNKKRYVHCIANDTDKTIFASHIKISPLQYENNGATVEVNDENNTPQGYIVDALVLVRDGANYREYDAKTAITDWIQ